jgi:DHA1 family tetracycline resistance protein-like MFS transporter
MTDTTASPTPAPPAASRASIAFVLVTVTLDVLAIGIVVPVLPKLVETFLGGDTAKAAAVFGLMSMTWALMQLLSSPVLGALSDTYGRRPVLLLSNLALGLDYVLMALAPTLAWLFVGRVLAGIAAATFSTATAYIADVTAPEKRAAAFGMIGAAFGVGFVIGPALGGILGAYDPRLPFWVAAGLSLANAAYGYFILPESLPPQNRAPFTIKRASLTTSIRLLFAEPKRRPIAIALFLYQLAHAALPAVFVLFAAHRFGWTTVEIGLVLALVGICWGVVQAGLVGPLVARLGALRTLQLGLLMGILGFIVQAWTLSPWVYIAGIPFFSLWVVTVPAAMQILSAEIGADAQGQLQGANASLHSIGSLIGPLLFSGAFAWGIGPGMPAAYAGAPFAIAAVLLAVGLAVLLQATRRGQLGSEPSA